MIASMFLGHTTNPRCLHSTVHTMSRGLVRFDFETAERVRLIRRGLLYFDYEQSKRQQCQSKFWFASRMFLKANLFSAMHCMNLNFQTAFNCDIMTSPDMYQIDLQLMSNIVKAIGQNKSSSEMEMQVPLIWVANKLITRDAQKNQSLLTQNLICLTGIRVAKYENLEDAFGRRLETVSYKFLKDGHD